MRIWRRRAIICCSFSIRMVSRLWPRSCNCSEPRMHGPLGVALVVLLWATRAPAHEPVLLDARRATPGLHLENAGTMSPITWYPTCYPHSQDALGAHLHLPLFS